MMKDCLRICIPFFLFAIFSCSSPKAFLWNHTQIKCAHNSHNKSVTNLIGDAEKYIKMSYCSVLDKKHMPVSGDKHDYMSLSRYAWPDLTKKNGLPYITKDGETNPEYKEYDRNSLANMCHRVKTTTLAWKITGDSKYAEWSLNQLRVWFINQDTRMNPNMEYAQFIKGRNNERGYCYGIIDAYSFVDLMDALLLMETYKGYTPKDKKGLTTWFKLFSQWMRDSENGRKECAAKNNHGTSYDIQMLAYNLYIGERKKAKAIVDSFAVKRIFSQINEDGRQPLELVRTLSYKYSVYNLTHIIDFMCIAIRYGYHFDNGTIARVISACEYLNKYTGKRLSVWPYKQISITDWEKYQKTFLFDLYRVGTYIDPSRQDFIDIYRKNENKLNNDLRKILF